MEEAAPPTRRPAPPAPTTPSLTERRASGGSAIRPAVGAAIGWSSCSAPVAATTPIAQGRPVDSAARAAAPVSTSSGYGVPSLPSDGGPHEPHRLGTDPRSCHGNRSLLQH